MGDTVEQLVRTVASQQEGHRFEQADKISLTIFCALCQGFPQRHLKMIAL